MSRRILSIAAAILVCAPSAFASPAYPAVFQDELKLTEAPLCTICHQGATGAGTVTTDLGRALRSRGLVGGGNEASLRTAITALVAEGNPAIKPYTSGGNVVNVAGPEYGCAFGARAADRSAWASAIGVGLALVFGRRRRS